jgi:hypothetical protein
VASIVRFVRISTLLDNLCVAGPLTEFPASVEPEGSVATPPPLAKWTQRIPTGASCVPDIRLSASWYYSGCTCPMCTEALHEE